MKRKWIFILGFCVVIAFFVQVIFYLIFIKRFLGSGHFHIDKIKNSQVAIRTFLIICGKYDAPVIPVDRQTLLKFHLHGATLIDQVIDSYDGDVFPFLTFNEVFDNKVVMTLTDSGFHHASMSQPDAKLLSQNIVSQLVLHHVFTINHFAIHVTVCYHRDGNFWWHGHFSFDGISPPLPSQFSAADFRFAHSEGAYDEFPVTPLKKDLIKIYVPSNITNFLHQVNDSKFIECNHTRSNLFYSRFKMDISDNAMAFRAVAWKTLRMAKTVLGRLGIRFWLSSGTCLGYFRQCDIFPYGKDMDIGIWIKDYHPQIVTGLLAAGMNLKHKLGKVEDSLELSFIVEGIKLDIFFFYEEADHVWNGGLQTKSGKKFKYIFPKFDLCWTEFLGLKVSVPCQTESYITANYGPNWFQPVMEWDWKTSPFNVRYNGMWPEEEWNEVIQVADFQFK